MARKHFLSYSAALALTIVAFLACNATSKHVDNSSATAGDTDSTLQHATFAMGCFWHSEEIFLEMKGVKNALPGYAGGTESDPTYDLVGSGTTRYAESVDVAFDPFQISYEKLLEVFFAEHDPTSLNRQGPDEGPQYRSAIFYRNDSQRGAAESYIKQIQGKYAEPIATEVAPLTQFHRAEDYHLRYYRNHPDQPYIAEVTRPEVEKFRRDFPDLIQH